MSGLNTVLIWGGTIYIIIIIIISKIHTCSYRKWNGAWVISIFMNDSMYMYIYTKMVALSYRTNPMLVCHTNKGIDLYMHGVLVECTTSLGLISTIKGQFYADKNTCMYNVHPVYPNTCIHVQKVEHVYVTFQSITRDNPLHLIT